MHAVQTSDSVDSHVNASRGKACAWVVETLGRAASLAACLDLEWFLSYRKLGWHGP